MIDTYGLMDGRSFNHDEEDDHHDHNDDNTADDGRDLR